MREKGKALGRAEGEKRKTKEVAMATLKKDFSTADIMDVTGLSEKEMDLIKTQM